MSPLQIAIIAIVVIALAVVIWLVLKTQRTKQLQSRFGPEYQRAVRSEGTARAAEKVLQERQQRVERLEITPLSEQQRKRFAEAWDNEQAHFVDEPVRLWSQLTSCRRCNEGTRISSQHLSNESRMFPWIIRRS